MTSVKHLKLPSPAALKSGSWQEGPQLRQAASSPGQQILSEDQPSRARIKEAHRSSAYLAVHTTLTASSSALLISFINRTRIPNGLKLSNRLLLTPGESASSFDRALLPGHHRSNPPFSAGLAARPSLKHSEIPK